MIVEFSAGSTEFNLRLSSTRGISSEDQEHDRLKQVLNIAEIWSAEN